MLDTDRRVDHDLTVVLPLTAGEPAHCLSPRWCLGVWVSGPVAKETPASDLRDALAHVLVGRHFRSMSLYGPAVRKEVYGDTPALSQNSRQILQGGVPRRQ